MDGQFYVDTRQPHMAANWPSVTLAATDKALVPVAGLPPMGTNYWSYIGKALRITMFGAYTSGTTPGNGTFDIYWGPGSDAIGDLVGVSSTFAIPVSQVSQVWFLQLLLRCRNLGSSGQLLVTGWGWIGPSFLLFSVPSSAPVAVTANLTTAGNSISPQFKRSGSTAETMQVVECLYESLN